MNTDIEGTIRTFVEENFITDDLVPPKDEESLFERGIVDSVGMIEVVSFVEEAFGITVAEEDLVPDNFGSIEAIGQFVRQKLKVTP